MKRSVAGRVVLIILLVGFLMIFAQTEVDFVYAGF